MARPERELLSALLLARAGVHDNAASSVPLQVRQDASAPQQKPIGPAASYYVSDLPGLKDHQLKLYAGHLPATSATTSSDSDANLFFLLAKARHIAERQRLIVWLNGGPGCSSFDGALMEVGPVRMHPTMPNQLVANQGAWNEYANVVFIDQPAGTGFSYHNTGQPVRELAPAADQVVTFLENFYTVFPEMAAFDLYLAGESYAGQYIPYIATAILKTKVIKASLKGLLMGNAWLDPETQYPAYLDFALEQGIIGEDSAEAQRAKTLSEQCDVVLRGAGKGKVLVPECEGLLFAVMPNPDAQNRCVNGYNTQILEPCGSKYPADAPRVKPYLRTPSVVSAMHAQAKTVPWEQCNNTIGNEMWSPASRPAVELLPDLLAQDVQIGLFAGELDVVCNWLGVQRTIQKLTWADGKGMNTTSEDWFVNGARAGSWQTDRGMHWIRVANASHMVAIEKPIEAHDMMLRFTGIVPVAAVGEAAKLPTRLGNKGDIVVGLLAPDGRTLNSSLAVDDMDDAPPIVADPTLSEDELDVIQQDREAYYGPRRSAVLALLLIVVIVALGLALRWRTQSRKQRRQRHEAVATDEDTAELDDEVHKREEGDV